MKKLLATLMALVCGAMLGCSAGGGEDIGEATQALAPACSITGISGTAALPVETVITAIEKGPVTQGQHSLRVTACEVGGGPCWTSLHQFAEVHWTTVNGNFIASEAHPLRYVKVSAPGCQLSSPSSYCFDFRADLDVGSQVNPLQNVARFLSDRAVNTGSIAYGSVNTPAPPGVGIVFIQGVSLATNTWQMKYPNSSTLSLLTKNWFFTVPGC